VGTLPRCNAGGVGETKCTIEHEVTFGIRSVTSESEGAIVDASLNFSNSRCVEQRPNKLIR